MEGIIGNNNNNNNGEKGGIIISGNKKRIENPFSLKVLQVFTGFGIGCGLGIGVGHPINLGAIPMLGEVMVAARGATDAFSGVTRHVNQSLKRYGPKFGPKNIEAGIGCGVGFGHGFGVGLAVKPGVLHQAQLYILETMGKMITKFGIAPNLSNFQGNLPASLQSGIPMLSNSTNQNQIGSIMGLTEKVPNNASQGLSRVANSQIVSATETFASQPPPLNTQYESRTEKVINNFLQSPILKGENRGPDELLRDTAERLRSENNVLQLVLKHQQLIEELMEENMKLREILVEDLKIPPGKLKAGSSSKSTECFKCRRKQRRR